jgi:hypothetical protein
VTEQRKKVEGRNEYLPVKSSRAKTSMAEDIMAKVGEMSNLKILELGKAMYSFANSLDPLVAATKKAKQLLEWRRPEVTIALGVLLSLLVLFPKFSIIIFSVFLIFGKGYIITQFQKSVSKEEAPMRLLPP